MKKSHTLIIFGALSAASLSAQVEIPANPTVGPKKSTTRSVGGGVNPGVSVDPSKPTNPDLRYVTHIVLSETRQWTNSEGKSLEAKLVAFEDLVAQAPKGSAEPVMPAPPANPTVVRDGKARLLVNKKPVEIALERLNEADRDFIERIKTSLAKKAEVR